MAQLVKNPPTMWETWVCLIPGLGRSPGEGKGYPLQYSGLEKSKGSQRVRQDRMTFTSTSTSNAMGRLIILYFCYFTNGMILNGPR